MRLSRHRRIASTATAETPLSSSPPPSPTSMKRLSFRKALRGCFSSSNPDTDPDTSPANPRPISPYEMEQQPNPKRLSYVPRHAGISFNRTTTPLAVRDPERAKRALAIFSTAYDSPFGVSTEDLLRVRRRTAGY